MDRYIGMGIGIHIGIAIDIGTQIGTGSEITHRARDVPGLDLRGYIPRFK